MKLKCAACGTSFEVPLAHYVKRVNCSVACRAKYREATNWPSIDKLKEMVQDSSYSQVGRELGVSDNAVRKRIKTHTDTFDC